MPALLIVDDRDLAQALLAHAKCRDRFSALTGAPPDFGRIDNDPTYESLLTWFETGIVGEGGRTPDLAIILDLALRTGVDTIGAWPSVHKRLDHTLPDLTAIDEEVRDGFAVLHALRASPWVRTALVVIASGRTPVGVPEAIDEFNALFQAEGKSIVCVSKLGRIAIADPSGHLLDVAADAWHNHFGVHDDLVISGFINEYAAPLRNPATTAAAWRHDAWFGTANGQEAAPKLLNLSSAPDTTSLKGLFMLNTARVDFDSRTYNVTPAVLESALNRLDLQNWVVEMDAAIQLPITPGIAFLLAARQLVLELARETAAVGVELRVDVMSHALRVNLGEHRHRNHHDSPAGGGWGCVPKFLKKMQGGDTWHFPNDGLSGAISNVARCRVSGLRNPQQDPLIAMLDRGLPHWVAWPSFMETSIEFRW